MTQKTTLKEIASILGLDVSTVSRALRGDQRVKPQTRKLIKEKARLLNYVPNLAARNLVAGKTKTILFILSSLENINESYPCQRSFEYLQKAGYSMFCALGRQNKKHSRELLAKLQQGIADGALFIPCGDEDADMLEPTLSRGLPVVLIDRDIPDTNVPLVTTDNIRASYELVKWAYEEGCREFIEVFDDNANSVTTDRQQGARQAFKDLNVTYCGREGLKSAPSCPVAVIGTNQSSTYNIITQQQPLLSGVDVYVGVFDNWEGSSYPAKKVRIAVQDFSSIAEKAVEIMISMLNDDEQNFNKFYHIPVKEHLTITGDFTQ